MDGERVKQINWRNWKLCAKNSLCPPSFLEEIAIEAMKVRQLQVLNEVMQNPRTWQTTKEEVQSFLNTV